MIGLTILNPNFHEIWLVLEIVTAEQTVNIDQSSMHNPRCYPFFSLSCPQRFIETACSKTLPPDHVLLDSAPNLGPLISRWETNKFENCWYKSVRILVVLKLLF